MKNYTQALEIEMQEDKKLEEVERELRQVYARLEFCKKQQTKANALAKTLKKEKIINIVGTFVMGAISVAGFLVGVPGIGLATAFLTVGNGGFAVNSFLNSKNIKNYQKQLEKFEAQSKKYIDYLESEKKWANIAKIELEKLQAEEYTMAPQDYNVELQKIKNLRAVNSRNLMLEKISEQKSALNLQYLNVADESIQLGLENE